MKTPEAHETLEGSAVDLGKLYRYETKKRGTRYILSAWRVDGSPRKFYITRDQVHEAIDELLDGLDASAVSKPNPAGNASRKWSAQ